MASTLRIGGAWVALILAGAYFAFNSPEQVYMSGWEAMNASKYPEASEKFQRAYEMRKPPAKKEEALFWSAKSSELAGKREQAKARYRELIERYHGFWLPEALYTYVLLEWEDGNRATTAPYAQRLREEYPNNRWTKKLDELK